MKLNMSMVEARLKDCVIESNIQSNACTIRGLRFLTEGESGYSSEFIYISLARDYLTDPRYENALILASGRSNIVCEGLEYEELINDVLSAFDYYSEAERKLAKLATEHAPIPEMAKTISRLIEAPFLVFGVDGAYLGGAHLNLLTDKRLLKSIREQGSLGAGIIGSRFVDEAESRRYDLSTKPKMMRGPEGQRAVNMYLSDGDETVGFIMCFPPNAQQTHIAFALEPLLASHLSSAHEFVDKTSSHQALHRSLADFLRGEDMPRETAERIERSLGPTQRLNVVLVRSLQVANLTQRILLAQEISAVHPHCIATEIDEAVAFLAPHRQVDALIGHILERFDPANAAIGVSMPVVGIERAAMAMRQAEFACGEQPIAGVRQCKDLALPFLLRALRSEPTTQDLLHPAIGILAAYDADHRTQLADTLRAYLDARYNQVDAAKRLHVHLNTFKYRLKRIEEITSLDFLNQSDMLYLQLSFELQA